MDIKALRKEYGYTQRKLAHLLEVDITTVQKWESGDRNPGRRSQKDLDKLFPTKQEVDKLMDDIERDGSR